jgi:hypothetical protein
MSEGFCQYCGKTIERNYQAHRRIFGERERQKDRARYFTKFVGMLCNECATSSDADLKWASISKKAREWENWTR